MAEKILIVDDDLETLRLVSIMLQKQGYQTLTAPEGKAGIALAVSDKPDLIVLDVMMPGIDGFKITRMLKENPATANIPILMFTAKSQVEDKVQGYDSGADDYLTKPIHPAELIAHIRALVSRTKTVQTASSKQGAVIGIVSAKGGMGVSTLALNLAIAYHYKTTLDVIAAEVRPGQGTWSGELNFSNPNGLVNLLKLPPDQIKRDVVEGELIKTSYGARLLLASTASEDFKLLANGLPQLEQIVKWMASISKFLVLDIGTPFIPGFGQILSWLDELIVVGEPQPYSLRRTAQFIDELQNYGVGTNKPLHVVIINRVRADLQLSATQIQDMLGRPLALVVPPAPEQSYHAAMRNIPLSMLQPEGILAQQINRLAAQFAERFIK